MDDEKNHDDCQDSHGYPEQLSRRNNNPVNTTLRTVASDFFLRVYGVVVRIPYGRVTTYGAIAKHIGAGRSARAVGYALNAVAGDDDMPCHRVVNRNGELSGKVHFATPTLMRELLEEEGVAFDGERVVLDEYFWDPGPPVLD